MPGRTRRKTTPPAAASVANVDVLPDGLTADVEAVDAEDRVAVLAALIDASRITGHGPGSIVALTDGRGAFRAPVEVAEQAGYITAEQPDAEPAEDPENTDEEGK